MINHCGRIHFSFCLTHDAEGMPAKKSVSRLAPPTVVAPEGSAAAQTVTALGDVFLAVNLPLFAESGAAGIAAGASRFHGHVLYLIPFNMRVVRAFRNSSADTSVFWLST